MHSITLDSDNLDQVSAALAGDNWVVACLCAAWCGTCAGYRATFEQLAERHPGQLFLWIDIEDCADVVGELDIENFPTLLIQRADQVAFFGTVTPDPGVAQRLLQAQMTHSPAELAQLTAGNPERGEWQRSCNLRTLLAAAAA